MNRLRKLANYGQSYWMDDLSRDLLRNGDLPRKIRDTGLRGITSNPAIFGQAIGEPALVLRLNTRARNPALG